MSRWLWLLFQQRKVNSSRENLSACFRNGSSVPRGNQIKQNRFPEDVGRELVTGSGERKAEIRPKLARAARRLPVGGCVLTPGSESDQVQPRRVEGGPAS